MKKRILAVVLPVACLVVPVHLNARVTTLSGGVSTGYDYSDREYVTAIERDDDYSRFVISPFVQIVTRSPRDTLDFKYTPELFYDVDDSESDVNHNVNFNYERFFTKKWQVNILDAFINTDQFTSFRTDDDQLTAAVEGTPVEGGVDAPADDDGRRRYTQNTFDISTTYTYYEDSTLRFGYINTILRNDEDEGGESYEDYDKHDLGVDLAHRINSQWRFLGSLGFIRGEYEPVDDESGDDGDILSSSEDDVKEYSAEATAEYEPFQHHITTVGYAYRKSDFDLDERPDNQIHDITVGWRWDVSPKLKVSLGAGPTYSERDDTDGEWDYNGNASLTYSLEKGVFNFTAAGGQEFDNFTGDGERGATEYLEARADFRYSPIQYTTLGLYASYRDEDKEIIADTESNSEIISQIQAGGDPAGQLDLIDENTRIAAVGCSISYIISEHFTADFGYDYVDNSSDDADAEYDEHRFTFMVTYENDFMQWQ